MTNHVGDLSPFLHGVQPLPDGRLQSWWDDYCPPGRIDKQHVEEEMLSNMAHHGHNVFAFYYKDNLSRHIDYYYDDEMALTILFS